MQVAKLSNHPHHHHCSHDHIHGHPNDKKIDISNVNKKTIQLTKNLSGLMPKQLRQNTEKIPAEMHALSQELDFYKSELARVQQIQRASSRQIQQENKMKAGLYKANHVNKKIKKNCQALSEQQKYLVKKVNELDDKMAKGNSQIQSLRIVHDTKVETKKQTKKTAKNPENIGTSLRANPKGLANLQNTSQGITIQQLEQENQMLRERLSLYQAAQKQSQFIFEPILQENADQIKQLLAQKGKYLQEISQLKQQLDQLQSNSKHQEQKYRNIEVDFNKLKVEYQKATKGFIGSTRIGQSLDKKTTYNDTKELQILKDKVKQAEYVIQQFEALNENNKSRISHLENSNRYLVCENKRFIQLLKNNASSI